MSYLGKILNLPNMIASRFATVRDEYGNTLSVDADELPKNSKEGDDFAYRVEFNKTNEVVIKNDKK